MDRKTLVPGLGNTLLGDKGVGVYAVRALQEQYADRADVEFLDGGTLSFTLAGPIEDADSRCAPGRRRDLSAAALAHPCARGICASCTSEFGTWNAESTIEYSVFDLFRAPVLFFNGVL